MDEEAPVVFKTALPPVRASAPAEVGGLRNSIAASAPQYPHSKRFFPKLDFALKRSAFAVPSCLIAAELPRWQQRPSVLVELETGR